MIEDFQGGQLTIIINFEKMLQKFLFPVIPKFSQLLKLELTRRLHPSVTKVCSNHLPLNFPVRILYDFVNHLRVCRNLFTVDTMGTRGQL